MGQPDERDDDSDKAGAEDLEDVVDAIEEHAEEVDEKKTTFGRLLHVFSDRAHGPLLLIPGIISVSPVGAIPGMSIAMGSVIALVSVQILIFSGRPWIPKRLEKVELPTELLEKSADKVRPWAKWIDKRLHARLQALVGEAGKRVIAACCVVLGAAMWPLALLPFAVSAPGAAVTLFGLALMLRDGLLALIGFVTTGLVVAGTIWFLLG